MEDAVKKHGTLYSEKSLTILESCHIELARLFYDVGRQIDCTILSGYRGEDEQDELFRRGFSKLKFSASNHNKMPSMAVDAAPFPIDWDDLTRFYYFGGFVKGTAFKRGLTIRWGGDWDSDINTPNRFNDLVHFELIL